LLYLSIRTHAYVSASSRISYFTPRNSEVPESLKVNDRRVVSIDENAKDFTQRGTSVILLSNT